eukprot:scaffold257443_cov27-Tisochrysis_lutea.AAC.4
MPASPRVASASGSVEAAGEELCKYHTTLHSASSSTSHFSRTGRTRPRQRTQARRPGKGCALDRPRSPRCRPAHTSRAARAAAGVACSRSRRTHSANRRPRGSSGRSSARRSERWRPMRQSAQGEARAPLSARSWHRTK